MMTLDFHNCVGTFGQEQDVPQFHPLPDNHRYPITLNQNHIAGSVIFTAECVARISNNTRQQLQDLVYGITSTEYFIVNSTTGDVSLTIDARDFPGGGPFTAILYCKYADSDGTSTVELSVRYEIENIHVPKFTHGEVLDVWVREDHTQTEGHVIIQLNVTDDDLKPCNTVTFTIESGNEDGMFRIGSKRGVLENSMQLDYDTQHKYNLTIRATNMECGQRFYFAQATVCIYIEDVDDEHPIFDQRLYLFNFDEQEQPNNFVQLNCSDVDTAGAQLVYEEDYTQGENPFTIDHRTGYVSATQSLDYEERTSYHLVFICYNVLNPSVQDTAVVKVQVNPINDHFPEVSPTFAYIPFSYTSPVGTLLVSSGNYSNSLIHLDVLDRDRGSDHNQVYFKFVRSKYYDYFHLDADSGNLTLLRQFDFDACSSNFNSYISLQIVVCDTLQDSNRLQFCPVVAIFVSIISPSCSLTFLKENYTIYVSESATVGSELLVVHCEIPGISRNNTSLQRTIEVYSPNSQFSHTLRIEDNRMILQETLDYESVQQFTIYLRCSNIDGQESIAAVFVNVLPENDNSPFFQKCLYSFRVTTEQFNSLPKTVGYISAIDKDQGTVNNLMYSLTQNQDFDSTNDVSQYFTLNGTENGTVAIIITELPNEEISVFNIIVSDGINTDQCSVLIYFTDGLLVSSSSSLSTDQCRGICILLLIILIVFMLLTIVIIAVLVCICFASKRKRPVPLTNTMELQDTKSHTIGYSSLQRNNLAQTSVKSQM